jgi:hypothetical protein
MTSEWQRAANRRNAKMSSGPKTAIGKSRSSKNALQHGLAAHRPYSESERRRITWFAGEIIKCTEGATSPSHACAIAAAQIALENARQVEAEILKAFCTDDLIDLDPTHRTSVLHRLKKVERYSTRAVGRRHRLLGSIVAESRTGESD